MDETLARVVAERVAKLFTNIHGQTITAVADVSFSVNDGECVCIVGRTGCGKSTILSMLLGLEEPTSGELLIDGRSPVADFRHFRGQIAAVFQTDRLLPWRNALDNARVGLEVLGFNIEEQADRAGSWLAMLGLSGFERAFPHELSGGMRQRVAMARAFAVDPDILLLDEAFGHLDEATAQKLRADFLAVLGETGKTCIIVTHSIGEAIEMASRILVMGKPAKVLRDVLLSPEDRSQNAGQVRQEIVSLIQGSSEE